MRLFKDSLIYKIFLNKNKYLYLRIFIVSILFRVMIYFMPFSFSKKYFGIANSESKFIVSKSERKIGVKISKAVYKLSYHMPFKVNCLVNAITMKYILKKSNVESTLYLGVYKNKVNNNLEAHAWLRLGNDIISGKEDMNNFKKVSSFN